MTQKATFQGQEIHVLSQGGGTARISAAHGARLLDWRVDGREIVHWPADADWSKPNKIRGGNPILFPFIARHYVDGVLGRWKDAQGTVRELPMHGFVRDAAFTVVEGTPANELRMRLSESAETLAYYPFPFLFEVAYRLDAEGTTLEVELATTNTGTQLLPYYAGHHFYFAVDHASRAQWEITLPFAKTVTQSPEGIPIPGPAPAATPATLAQPELIDRIQVEPTANRFSLTDRRDGSAIDFDLAPRETVPWYAVTTWTEKPDSDFYCVEPWLGLPNAIHHGRGLRILAPGATERGVCSLHYRAK